MGRRDTDGDSFPTMTLGATTTAGDWVLRIVAPDHVRTQRLPTRGDVVVGRGENVEISISDPSVSRRHAVLHVGETLLIEDLGSRHGTTVGGRRLAASEQAPVPPGVPIGLGSVVVLAQKRALGPVAAPPRPGGAAESREPVVSDPAMIELHRLIDKFAPGNISVLLLGETGVGKEVTAGLIHRRSRRAQRPFVGLNCGAFTETLLESELFGHERGAFTGASATKPGLLETAEGGTVLLDEVGELPMSLQVKLLRVLEERRVLRVGGVKPIAIDVRFISATNRDLEAEIEAGRFRQDLFFRLNGATLQIPPLRERPTEIEAMSVLFAREFSEQLGFATPGFSSEARALLRAHAWPGNVRELRNLIERAVLLSAGELLTPEHFPISSSRGQQAARAVVPAAAPEAAAQADPVAKQQLWGDIDALERARVLEALQQCAGNQTRAAKLLGISRGTLSARLAAYGVPRPRKPDSSK